MILGFRRRLRASRIINQNRVCQGKKGGRVRAQGAGAGFWISGAVKEVSHDVRKEKGECE